MKKIIAVIMAVFMLFSMAGCSAEELKLYDEMKKAASWDTEETKGIITILGKVDDQDIKITGDFTGFINAKDKQAYIEFKLNPVELANTKSDFRFAPVKIYLDNQNFYITATYIKDLFNVLGEPLPNKLLEVKTEYIGMNVAQGMISHAAVFELLQKLVIHSKVNMPIIEKDREYTVSLDSDQTIKLLGAFTEGILNNMDEVNKISNTGITQKDVNAQKAKFDEMVEQGKGKLKQIIDGSKVKAQYTFGDDQYKQSLGAALKIHMGKEEVTMDLNIARESVKSAKKVIVLPDSKQVYTREQLMALIRPLASLNTSVITGSEGSGTLK